MLISYGHRLRRNKSGVLLCLLLRSSLVLIHCFQYIIQVIFECVTVSFWRLLLSFELVWVIGKLFKLIEKIVGHIKIRLLRRDLSIYNYILIIYGLLYIE